MIVASRSAGRASRLDSFEKKIAVVRYVSELADRPWQWGECDCTMAVADWIKEVRGINPLAKYRGAYSTADEARETAKQAGGFVPEIGRLFDEAGMKRVMIPEDGDVAMVIVPPKFRNVLPVVGVIMAIRFGKSWVCKGMKGVVGRTDFEPLHIWRP